jgi:hypothetical protein
MAAALLGSVIALNNTKATLLNKTFLKRSLENTVLRLTERLKHTTAL